jgi:hypothetical protein
VTATDEVGEVTSAPPARGRAGATASRSGRADDDDKLSAFRRSNDELTFRDFLIGKAGECSQQFFLEPMSRL